MVSGGLDSFEQSFSFLLVREKKAEKRSAGFLVRLKSWRVRW